MNQTQNTSPISSEKRKFKKHRTNWHEAAVCAIQIELRDYIDLLDFQPEYVLGKNSYRIDLLVIKKLNSTPISKNIARIFRTFNLFEIKGIGSSIKTNSYYKTIGYAGLLIDQLSISEQYFAHDISITFLCFHYPRKLIKHLTLERNLVVAKSSPGVYYVNKEIFNVQIIVTKELPPEENLYLRCLTDQLRDTVLVNRLAEDYREHQDQDIYIKYLHQLTNANNKRKGVIPMVCEGLLNLFGTSSEEIIAKTKKEEEAYYLPKIDELTSSNRQLTSSNQQLTSSNQQLTSSNQQLTSSNTLMFSQINYLKNLLKQNNIPFDLDSVK